MTVNHPPPQAEDIPPEQPPGSAAEALRTLRTFTREQVAWICAQVQRWAHEAGYEQGYQAGQRDEQALADIAAAYAYTSSFSGENTAREYAKVQRRRSADAAARLPRPGDHRGGPVEWDGQCETRVAA